MEFKLHAPFQATGDQPEAIAQLAAGLKAGLELEMPSSGGVNDQKIVEAVREGRLDEAVLDLSLIHI